MSHHRRMLRKSEAKLLTEEIAYFRDALEFDERETKMEVVEVSGMELFLFDGKPLLFKSEKQLVPTLFFERFVSSAPQITVDMGAIPYVCNGADVMAPGVRAITGGFLNGEFVVIKDEKYGKSIAVGRALFDSEAMRKTTRGAVVKTVHYVGDEMYNLSKTF